MEKPVAPIYIDAARSYGYSEIEKIESILNQNYQPFIKEKCKKIKSFLIDSIQKIEDHHDLLEFKGQLSFISPLLDLFIISSDSKSAWWAMSLIKECYEKCGIDHSKRNILIVHYLNSNDYSVSADLLSISPIPELKNDENPIDAFIIPSEAKHDVSSIALIGHEVGHIYWKQNFEKIRKVVNQVFENEARDSKMPLLHEETVTVRSGIIANYVEEFLCDKIGRYLLGPAFDFALLKYFTAHQNNHYGSTTHPPDDSRKEESFESLKKYKSGISEVETCYKNLIEYLPHFEPVLPFDQVNDEFSKALAEKIHQETQFQASLHELFDEKWKRVKPELDAFRPPFESVSSEAPQYITPIDAIVASTLYYYGRQYRITNDFYLKNKKLDTKEETVRSKLVEHLRYAISVHEFVKQAQDRYCKENFSKEEMHETLWTMRDRKSGDNNPFVITPTINPKSQYNATSVDLRLGSSFLIHRTTGFTHIEPQPRPTGTLDEAVPLDAFYDELYIPVGKNFILHPHQFVLAATLEYVSVPFDFYALVLGRSSWGRLGLNIATATAVNAGFRGCITLELRNLGETPLPLKVGLRIAQLCLVPVSIDTVGGGYYTTSGKYIGPVGPEIPKIKGDADWDLLSDPVNNGVI